MDLLSFYIYLEYDSYYTVVFDLHSCRVIHHRPVDPEMVFKLI